MRCVPARAALWPAVLLALAALAPAAAAELRRMEAVGSAPVDGSAGGGAPRDLALRRALADAVLRVALQEAPDVDPDDAEPVLRRALGDEPLDYASRYRILEDRGERPALFAEDPDVAREYVVLVEVQVDAGLVRERLAAAGLLAAPSGETSGVRLELVARGVDSYDAYRALRAALVDGAGARSARLVEIERGRAVFAVESERGPRALLEALRAATPELRIVLLSASADRLDVRVDGEGAAAAAPIDTPGRKRY